MLVIEQYFPVVYLVCFLQHCQKLAVALSTNRSIKWHQDVMLFSISFYPKVGSVWLRMDASHMVVCIQPGLAFLSLHVSLMLAVGSHFQGSDKVLCFFSVFCLLLSQT